MAPDSPEFSRYAVMCVRAYVCVRASACNGPTGSNPRPGDVRPGPDHGKRAKCDHATAQARPTIQTFCFDQKLLNFQRRTKKKLKKNRRPLAGDILYIYSCTMFNQPARPALILLLC